MLLYNNRKKKKHFVAVEINFAKLNLQNSKISLLRTNFNFYIVNIKYIKLSLQYQNKP